jgi:DNA transformation protein
MQNSTQIRNIGKVTRVWLHELGIDSLQDLRRCGSVATFQLIRSHHPNASLNLLWSLEGAIQNLDWRDLPEYQKERLRRQVGL